MLRFDKKFFILFVFIAIVFLICAVYYYKKSVTPDQSITWIDFRVYYYAGLKLEMNGDIYDLSGAYFVYKYSPAFALIMSVIKFSTITPAGALCAWYAILFAALIAGFYILKRILFEEADEYKFGLFDIVPLLFIFRYLVLINFIKPYIIQQWPLFIRLYDIALLYVLTPLWILSFLVTGKKDSGRNFFGVMAVSFIFIIRFLALNIDRAQVNILIMLLVLFFAYYLMRNRGVLAGVYLGIAGVIKLTPLIFLIYLLAKRKFKTLFTAVLTFAALIFLPSFKLGFQNNIALLKNWLAILGATLPSEYIQYKNQSLFAAISRFFSADSDVAFIKLSAGPLAGLMAVTYGLFLGYLIFLVIRRPAGEENKNTAWDLALFFTAMTMLSPVGTKTTFIYTLFPVALLVKEAFRRHFKDKVLNSGLAVYLAVIYLNTGDIIGDFSVTLHKYSAMTSCLILIFALTVYARPARLTAQS